MTEEMREHCVRRLLELEKRGKTVGTHLDELRAVMLLMLASDSNKP